MGINKRHLCSVTARERNILDSIQSGSTKAIGNKFSGLGEIPVKHDFMSESVSQWYLSFMYRVSKKSHTPS